MRRTKFPLLSICLILAACTMPTRPEDAQMANSLCAQGKALLIAGKTAEALDVYDSATDRDGQNAQAWNGRGVANDMLGQQDKALDAYQKAVDLAPEDMSANNNLAHLYLEMGNAEDAVHLLQPLVDKPGALSTLRQNFEAATKVVRIKQEQAGDSYADLGAYPTNGMAQGHLAEIHQLLDVDMSGVILAITPEVKVGGGTPVFTIRATGRAPQSICDKLNAEAYPCIPHDKKS